MDKRSAIPMLAVLYGSAFIAAFNENVVNVALVSIMEEFAISADTAQWLVTGYMIVTSVVVTITAFLSKRFRLRSLFLAACALLLGGLIAGLILPGFWPFLLARLVQSIGTGIFIPLMMSTVLAIAPRERMGTYLSIGGCMITFGPAFAPVISGFMVTAFGWRSVLLPPAIVIAIITIAGAICIKEIGRPERIALDIPSIALSAAGLFAFVYGLSIIASMPIPALGSIILGIGILCLFARRQRKLATPLLDLNPLGRPLFLPTCLLVVVAMMTTFSMSVLLPLYFEGATGLSAFLSGALLLIPILVNSLTALVGGRMIDKLGSWPVLPLGFGLIAVGQTLIACIAQGLSPAAVLAASVIVYAGVGLVFMPCQTAGLQTLSHAEHPHGVALLNTFVQVAASMGPSLFVGVLSTVAGSLAASGASESAAQAGGFAWAVAVAAAVGLAGFVLAFAYARKRHALKEAEVAQGV